MLPLTPRDARGYRREMSGGDVPRASAPPRHANVFVGFVPWIVFAVLASPSTWELAAVAGLIASVILAGPDLRARRPKVLEVTGVAFFLVLSVLALVLDRGDLDWVERYAQVISSGVIAVVALGSLFVMPFTEQYARESTPPEYWDSPTFRQINRTLTAVWGVVFAINAVLAWVSLHTGAGHDWPRWIIPVALIVGAVKFTAWYPDYVTGR